MHAMSDENVLSVSDKLLRDLQARVPADAAAMLLRMPPEQLESILASLPREFAAREAGACGSLLKDNLLEVRDFLESHKAASGSRYPAEPRSRKIAVARKSRALSLSG